MSIFHYIDAFVDPVSFFYTSVIHCELKSVINEPEIDVGRTLPSIEVIHDVHDPPCSFWTQSYHQSERCFWNFDLGVSMRDINAGF